MPWRCPSPLATACALSAVTLPSAPSGTGCSAPLEVQLLPQRRGLGGAGSEASCGGIKLAAGGVKKKRRGGERSRRKKQAAVAREGKEAARDEETRTETQQGPGAAGMFSFINSQLGEANLFPAVPSSAP